MATSTPVTLENLETLDITSWLAKGSPIKIDPAYGTVKAAAPLPADGRTFLYSAARLAKLRQFAQSGKFRAAGDVQKASPDLLSRVRARATTFANGWAVPAIATSTTTNAFVDDPRGAQILAAAWCSSAGIDVAKVNPALVTAFKALAASPATWDMSRRTISEAYQFSAAKVGGYIGAAYGQARYLLDADTRRRIEQVLLNNAWYAIGNIATGHNGSWFPRRLKGDYSQHSTDFYANTWKYPATPFFSLGVDQRDGLQKWLIPKTPASMDNQFASLVWMAALGAAANPQVPQLHEHVLRCLLEFVQFAVHGPTGLASEVGARQDDYDYPPQGRTYSSMIMQFLGGAAQVLDVTFGDRRAIEFSTTAGVMGSEGGPAKSLTRAGNALLDLISGKLPFQSAARLAKAALPTTPVAKDPNRAYSRLTKGSSEKVHELMLAGAMDALPGLRISDLYLRRGDFAGIPLPGTQGTPDSGNDYGGEYTGLIDPAPLLTYQDLVLGTASVPAPGPAPAPVTPAPPPPITLPPPPPLGGWKAVLGKWTMATPATRVQAVGTTNAPSLTLVARETTKPAIEERAVKVSAGQWTLDVELPVGDWNTALRMPDGTEEPIGRVTTGLSAWAANWKSITDNGDRPRLQAKVYGPIPEILLRKDARVVTLEVREAGDPWQMRDVTWQPLTAPGAGTYVWSREGIAPVVWSPAASPPPPSSAEPVIDLEAARRQLDAAEAAIAAARVALTGR